MSPFQLVTDLTKNQSHKPLYYFLMYQSDLTYLLQFC